MDNIEELKKLYYDPALGISGIEKTYKLAKERGLNITKDEVRKFVKAQKVHQLFQKPIKPINIPITAPSVGYYQGDLLAGIPFFFFAIFLFFAAG